MKHSQKLLSCCIRSFRTLMGQNVYNAPLLHEKFLHLSSWLPPFYAGCREVFGFSQGIRVDVCVIISQVGMTAFQFGKLHAEYILKAKDVFYKGWIN